MLQLFNVLVSRVKFQCKSNILMEVSLISQHHLHESPGIWRKKIGEGNEQNYHKLLKINIVKSRFWKKNFKNL